MESKNKHIRYALIDGHKRAIKYDMCIRVAETMPTPPAERYEYLGEGTIYSINGQLQTGDIRFKFYKEL